MSREIRCHYDVLGVERDADEATIKRAHRKLALKLHPDKNDGNHDEFLLVQQAYECLSDPTERKWYDEHRTAILAGWKTGEKADDIVFDVNPYMYAGCYSGYDDDAKGFYSVYRAAFHEIYVFELESNESMEGQLDDLSKAGLGTSDSSWDEVSFFYQVWESFSTSLSFAWADPWDLSQAEHRQVRRAMEDENKKARKAARKTYNDEILALVRFVKRRDPRVKRRQADLENEKIERERLRKEEEIARKKEKKEAMEVWRVQAEEELAAKEEEDRLAGRVRLADLEDDYDYGGKKGKKNKKKKNKQVCTSSDEGESDGKNGEAPAVENGDNGNVEMLEREESFDDESSSKSTEPDAWRCECCRKDFRSQGQMDNHLKSKKHKTAWQKYEKKLEQQALEEMLNDLDVGSGDD